MIKKQTKVWYEDEERGFSYRLKPVEDDIIVIETDDGFTVKYLAQDEHPDSPDQWGDENLFLVNYHRDFWVTRDEIIKKQDVVDYYQGQKIAQEKQYHIFPLSCLVHGGVWLSLKSSFVEDPGGWDTSHVGIVLVSKKEFSTHKKAFKAAESLVNEWNTYLTGDVYCSVTEYYDKQKNPIDYEVVCGYRGYEESIAELKNNSRREYESV